MSLQDLLGYGLQRPFQRDGKQSFAAAGGYAHLDSKIGQILGTVPGELFWDTEFGSNLDRLRHLDNNTDITPIARRYTVDALERYLPEVMVTEFTCKQVRDASGAETKLQIKLAYVLTTQQRGAVEIPGHELQVIL